MNRQYVAVIATIVVISTAGCMAADAPSGTATESATDTTRTATKTPPTEGVPSTNAKPTDTPVPNATIGVGPRMPPPNLTLFTAKPAPATLTPKPLPEQPENVTSENVVAFAAEYDHARLWNEVLTNETTSIGGGYVSELVRRTDTGYVVHLEASFGVNSRRGGTMGNGTPVMAVSDIRYTANYFINETTILRAEATGVKTNPGPSPWDGTVLEEPTDADG